jgi:hypothetical protein
MACVATVSGEARNLGCSLTVRPKGLKICLAPHLGHVSNFCGVKAIPLENRTNCWRDAGWCVRRPLNPT